MPRPQRLQGEARAAALARVPAWSVVDGRDAISRRFAFADFREAWGFMVQVALWAERHDHHPEWFNVYSRVEVILSTHDCGGLSRLDIELAEYMDHLSSRSLR